MPDTDQDSSTSDVTRNILSYALARLPFEPLPSQLKMLRKAVSFAVNGGSADVFVLNGYAGTGKTSLMGALIRSLVALKRKVVVLAPTGRAAKVAQAFSGQPVSTIHRRLFRPNPADPSGRSWCIAPNQSKDTLFIVDEASLISDEGQSMRSLLYILVRYVYSAPGCRMMLVGDEAQLPPVGQTSSTAMNPERLRQLGLNPILSVLDIPVRQAVESGIVHNATMVRLALFSDAAEIHPPVLEASGFPDVKVISSYDLADCLADSYANAGMDNTLVITRSNRRANDFNKAIRNMVMFAEEPLERGDRVVVAKNDYFWRRNNKGSRLIANGETAEVTWVGRTDKCYGRYFTEVELRLSDGDIVAAQVMLRSLVCDGPAISRQEMARFQNVVMDAYEGELTEKLKALDEDDYFNALQLKYAYCVTCHKAQGGQWKHVYIDMSNIDPEALGPDFYRWLYTAFTRATEKVFLINPSIPVE
ncbi:MAG: AAA family ATPase [Muribaculaceae bacterium]|nr:AAA family ATPase [Muribaculaceae bacterium]